MVLKLFKSFENKNYVFSILRYILSYCATALTSVALVQKLVISLGFSNDFIGLYGAVGSITSALTIFSLISVSDKIKNFISLRKLTAFSYTGYILIPLGIIFISLNTFLPSVVISVILICLVVFQNIIIAIYSIMDIRFISYTLKTSAVGGYYGISGFAGGILSLFIAGFINVIFSESQYTENNTTYYSDKFYVTMSAVFITGIIIYILSMYLYFGINKIVTGSNDADEAANDKPEQKITFLAEIKKVIDTYYFKSLITSNILRGISTGIAYFITSVGLLRFSGSETVTSYIIAITAAGVITGNLIITLIHKRINTGRLYFIGCLLFGSGLVISGFANNEIFYIISCFIFYTGSTIVDTGFPMGVYEVVPKENLGAYSSIRLLIHSGTASLSTIVCGRLLDFIPSFCIFAVAMIFQISGGYLFYKNIKKLSKIA
jgi:hypothetical protein